MAKTWREWFDEVTEGVVNFTPQQAQDLGLAQCSYCREWLTRENLVAVEYRPAKDRDGLEPVPAKVWWHCKKCAHKW